MAGTQYDVARSFYPLFGGFGPLELEPRRVGGPTRHGGVPIRRGALVLPPFGGIRFLGTRATSCWRPNASWRAPNATWRARFAPFLGVLVPLGSCHVALEVQRDMAHSQCDVACSFYPLFGGFGLLELEPRRVGGPTRHSGLSMRRGALVLLSFWGIWTLGSRATSCWRPNATWPSSNAAWLGAIQCDAPLSGYFNKKSHL